jgi:hypothetical protein
MHKIHLQIEKNVVGDWQIEIENEAFICHVYSAVIVSAASGSSGVDNTWTVVKVETEVDYIVDRLKT